MENRKWIGLSGGRKSFQPALPNRGDHRRRIFGDGVCLHAHFIFHLSQRPDFSKRELVQTGLRLCHCDRTDGRDFEANYVVANGHGPGHIARNERGARQINDDDDHLSYHCRVGGDLGVCPLYTHWRFSVQLASWYCQHIFNSL